MSRMIFFFLLERERIDKVMTLVLTDVSNTKGITMKFILLLDLPHWMLSSTGLFDQDEQQNPLFCICGLLNEYVSLQRLNTKTTTNNKIANIPHSILYANLKCNLCTHGPVTEYGCIHIPSMKLIQDLPLLGFHHWTNVKMTFDLYEKQ